MAGSRAVVCAAFCVLFAASAALAQDAAVSSGSDAGQALVNPSVKRIAINNDVNLLDFASVLNKLTNNGATPIPIARDLVIYSTRGATLDFGYLSGYIYLAPGVTLTLDGLRLVRAEAGIPFGIFKASPGATVVINNCVDQIQVGSPAAFEEGFFKNIPRPIAGTQSGSVDPATGDYTFTDTAFVVPVTRTNLGGYLLRFTNTLLAATTSRVSLPADNSVCQELPAFPSNACLGYVQAAVTSALCALPDCINSCRAGC